MAGNVTSAASSSPSSDPPRVHKAAVPTTTISGRPVKAVYTAEDIAGTPAADLAPPGVFPYTRGIHETGYRGKLWTMRQFAGFGSAEQTNARYKELLRAGGTGLSVA